MAISGYSATLAGTLLGALSGVESIAVGGIECRFDEVATLEAYRTGTATFTNGSTTVTGSGTSWTSSMAGRQIRLDADGTLHTIASVGGATSITLSANYSDTGGSGAYTILSDRLVEHVPLGLVESPIEVRFKYDKTVYDTCRDAAEARTADTFTLTDSGGSTHAGGGRIATVSDLDLNAQAHATFTVTIQPSTSWTFTPAA